MVLSSVQLGTKIMGPDPHKDSPVEMTSRLPCKAEKVQAAGRQLLAPHPCGLWQVTQAEAAARGHLRTVTFKRQPGARHRHWSSVCLSLTHTEQVSNPPSSLNTISPQTELAGTQLAGTAQGPRVDPRQAPQKYPSMGKAPLGAHSSRTEARS